MDYDVKIPRLHKKQLEIINHPARFKIAACGRRFGKNETAKFLCIDTLLVKHEIVFWVSPNFQMSHRVWKEMKEVLQNVIVWKSEQERTLQVIGGGMFRVFSGEKYENIRGEHAYLIIIDEAAIMPQLEDAWEAVITPALADKKGYAILLSTPRGHNYFYKLYLLGKDMREKDYQSFQFKSWDNPYMPKSEFINAFRRNSRKIFAQEYEAEFMLDAGEVFQGVVNVSTSPYLLPYDGNFVFGIDIGIKDDYTVISIFDIDTKTMVDMKRLNETEWSVVKKLIKTTNEEWKPKALVIETNYGDSMIQDLINEGMSNIIPFRTTNTSKQEIVSNMIVGIQNKAIKLLNDNDLIREFQAYKMDYTKTGRVSYSASSGYHDDIVMSCCLGYHYFKELNAVYGLGLPKLSGWSQRD